jgi:DNA-binding response OmpR family regulator
MKILIVEDEPGILQFLNQGLSEESYSVDIAENGLAGLQFALNNNYDLILLDWMLPGMNGIDICKAIRKQKNTTPIIFLTSKDTISDTIEGLQAGGNDYIKKPFHFEELLARIEVQLRSQNKNIIEKYEIGNITIDENTHQVFLEKEEIQLTQKEYDLFKYLVKNKGNVCTRTNIIKDVWDIHFEYDTGVIDVYINALRKKLNLSEDRNYIQTIRGVGYIIK